MSSTLSEPVRTSRRIRPSSYRLLASIAVALVFVLLALTPFAHRLENTSALSLLYTLRGPRNPPPGALIVAIDRASLEWLRALGQGGIEPPPDLGRCLPLRDRVELARVRGPGDLPRVLHACFVDALRALSVPVIVLDILFSVPTDPEGDQRLATALRMHGATAVLVGFERSTVAEGGAELLVEREVQPFALLRVSAGGLGGFPVTRSSGPVYGYWRALPGFHDTPSLIEEALRLFGAATVPESAEESFRYLWYYGEPGSIQTISLREVIEGSVRENLPPALSRSVVFVGASDPRSTNFPDSFPTFFPSRFGAEVSGVELAATAFLNRLEGRELRRLAPRGEALVVFAFCLVLSHIALAGRRFTFLLIVSLALLYIAAVSWLFSDQQLFLPLAVPIYVALPVIFLIAIIARYQLARALIMRLTPAPVGRRLLTGRVADPREASAKGDATVVFCDLIGSTSIGEQLPELTFSALLNQFFELTTHTIERHHGFVTAFTGDGLVALFRQLEAGTDHPVHACRAVLETVDAIGRMNLQNAARGLPPLAARFGLNSGQVAEGEIGSEGRFNFSVLGDVVNLGARLEQLGKVLFPGETVILLGSSTRAHIEGKGFQIEDCGMQVIAGRKTGENVFRLLSETQN